MTADRIPCSNCEVMVLPDTAKRFDGLCMLCYRKLYKNRPLSEEVKEAVVIEGYQNALINTSEFRKLDEVLGKDIPGCNRTRWHQPFTYDTEWMNGFYEEVKPKGLPFPPGVSMSYGSRTGMKPLVGVDINCCQLTKAQGRETYADTENNSNTVMRALGLPSFDGDNG